MSSLSSSWDGIARWAARQIPRAERFAYWVGCGFFWTVAAGIVVGMLIGVGYLLKDLWGAALGFTLVMSLFGCARYYAYKTWGEG